jgi:hypothetical protein
MSILADILGGILIPHVLALFVLFRIAMWEIRPEHRSTFRDSMARLWAWVRPHWYAMVVHPLYWAASGIVTAFFLVEPLRRIFT